MNNARRLLLLSAVFFLAGLGLFVRVLAVPRSPEEVARDFHVLFYESDAWNKMSWLGVKTLQYPGDAWVLQELITEIRPDFIIDSGTFNGGSALYMATVMEALELPGKILSIDIAPQVEKASKVKLFNERVEVFTSSSTDPALLASFKERLAGKRVLVLLDSLHTRDHVLAELEAYGPLVPVGSYLVVQDSNINYHPVKGDPGPGPWEAVHDFLPRHPEFEIDRSREKFLMTFSPDGYLKKVKPSP